MNGRWIGGTREFRSLSAAESPSTARGGMNQNPEPTVPAATLSRNTLYGFVIQ
jgi:hypothetical protein